MLTLFCVFDCLQQFALDVLTRKHQTHRTINRNCMQKVNKFGFIYTWKTVGIPLWRKYAVRREPFVGSEFVKYIDGGRNDEHTRSKEIDIIRWTMRMDWREKQKCWKKHSKRLQAAAAVSMWRDDIWWPELWIRVFLFDASKSPVLWIERLEKLFIEFMISCHHPQWQTHCCFSHSGLISLIFTIFHNIIIVFHTVYWV